MWSIIFTVVLSYLYVDNGIIAGRLSSNEDDTSMGNVTIKLRGASRFQDWLCYDEPSPEEIRKICNIIKMEDGLNNNCDADWLKSDELYNKLKEKYAKRLPAYIEKESDPGKKNRLMLELIYPDKIPMKEKSGWFYENFVKPNKLCVTETKSTEKEDNEPNFSFRAFFLKEKYVTFQTSYEGKNYSEVKSVKFGGKDIKIEIRKKPLQGEWMFDGGDVLWKIVQGDKDITITQLKGDKVNGYHFHEKNLI